MATSSSTGLVSERQRRKKLSLFYTVPLQMSNPVWYIIGMIIKKNWRIRTRNLTSNRIYSQVIFDATHEEALKIALADHPNSVMQSVEPGGDEIWIDPDNEQPPFHAKRPDFRKGWESQLAQFTLPPLPV